MLLTLIFNLDTGVVVQPPFVLIHLKVLLINKDVEEVMYLYVLFITLKLSAE